MLTDGALRMLVLLHFHKLGFSPLTLAYLFLLYEVMGMATNLAAGWIGARFGLAITLHAGLGLQILALMLLRQLDPAWDGLMAIVYVMAVQGLSGVAKDLAKTSAKSAVKLLAPAGGGLCRWVALLTGSKNAGKGLGFFLGTARLAGFGFASSLLLLAASLAVILLLVVLFMPPGLPRGLKSAKFRHVLSPNAAVNRLSVARLFLFAARDSWFVVGVPIFFYSVLSDGTAAGDKAAFYQVGLFMALWIIAYGAVQALTPRLLEGRDPGLAATLGLTRFWVGALAVILAGLTLMVVMATGLTPLILSLLLVAGLLVFGAVFALCSSLHSYLILAMASDHRVTMDVGFYYMSNAAGRLLGTLLSGLCYQFGGLALCLMASAILSGLSWLATLRLQQMKGADGQF
jgi:hypothetical protein